MDVFKWLLLVVFVLHLVHSYTYTLQRRLCVDIPMKFAGDKLACSFMSIMAETFLQKGYCLNPCDVSISNLWTNRRHKLSELVFKYGHQERQISLKEFCPDDYYNFFGYRRTLEVVRLSVDCSNQRLDYIHALCDINSDCGNNADCNLILNGGIGVCFRKSEHIRINGECYDADVPIGGACVSDIHCRDKTYSGICLHSTCTCGEGYVYNASENSCVAADHPVNGIFVPYIQCKDRLFSGVCLDSRCRCGEGFISRDNKCLAANVSIGGECIEDSQCSDGTYTGVCVNSKCTCREGYSSRGNKCLAENVALGGYCLLSEQCTGSIHAEVCKDERCVCKSGYVSYNQTCYRETNFDDMCFSWNTSCKDLTKECRLVKDFGICVCKTEYLGFGEKCLEGNLKINQTCERYEQCTAVQDLECQNGTCICRDGHVPVNETYCKPVEINENDVAKMFLNQEQANGLGATIGAVFGGFFIGVVLSALITYLISRRYMASIHKRDEISIKFDRHSAHIAPISENNPSQSAKVTEQTYQRKVVNVPPYSPSMESPTYSNVKEAKTSKMKEEDVYNHLHEKEDEKTENVYNHASCSSGQTTEDDYGHLNAGRSNEGVVLPEDDVYAHTDAANNDNYFVLENQSQI
ncbi:uncharacterized protein LOC134240738 isoform X2 [Saccostrea cucullata]|uniref:uncharacterized protein LOC134240738 isoform X2 n=1 Tax=Saccostrea cuccullata TaxID=36930 RepID=UPI002ED62384